MNPVHKIMCDVTIHPWTICNQDLSVIDFEYNICPGILWSRRKYGWYRFDVIAYILASSSVM